MLQRVMKKLRMIRYAPKIKVEHPANISRFGSEYGGWHFEPSPDLQGATIISCGLGEDASFDVEFAKRFGAKVLLVDPTPRALIHFQELEKQIGKSATTTYVAGGKQPGTAYDMTSLTKETFISEPSAIWIEDTRLKFFSPPSVSHVSHSITNFMNNYSTETSYIEVEALSLPSIMKKHNLTSIPLLKLDIEGAEVHVIPHILKAGVFPRQILVEYDEMAVATAKTQKTIEGVDQALRAAGYLCRHAERSNHLYTRST